MRTALIVSAVLHLSILIGILGSFGEPDGFSTPAVAALPVELVTIEEETDLTLGEPNETEVVENAAPETVEAPEPPAPVPTVSAGYWVLERSGTVHEFGAPDLDPGVLPAGAVAIAPVSDGNGAWLLTPDGDVVALGSAPDLGSVRGWLGADARAAALAGTPSGAGYWIVTDRGRVVPFGDAPPLGDILGVQLNAGVSDATSSSTGRGLYLVGGDGGVFALGDAVFHGSMGGQPLNAPVVGLAPTPSGAGYWLVASDGGVFAFGDASFRGSMGGQPLNQPVGGMVPYGADGYLLVASAGGVFVFSDAPFVGSLGDDPPPPPVVDVAPRPVPVG